MSEVLRPLRAAGTDSLATERRAAELLRAARPIESSPARMARVREGVKLRVHTRGRLLLRPALAVSVLLLTSAAAAAVSWWLSQAPPQPDRVLTPSGAPLAVPPPRAMTNSSNRQVATAPPSPDSSPDTATALDGLVSPLSLAGLSPSVFVAAPDAPAPSPPDARSPPEQDDSPAPRVARLVRAPVIAATLAIEPIEAEPVVDEGAETEPAVTEEVVAEDAPPEPPAVAEAPARDTPPDDEASLVLFAASKLRRDRDPRAVLHLLAFAANKFQDGALIQERIALEIEARLLLGDARARDLADRYMAQYPKGPFRAQAVEALRRFPR